MSAISIYVPGDVQKRRETPGDPVNNPEVALQSWSTKYKTINRIKNNNREIKIRSPKCRISRWFRVPRNSEKLVNLHTFKSGIVPGVKIN